VLEVTGGTHNRAAPPFEFLDLALLPLLRRMGAEVRLEMTRPGFEPAGGGRYRLEVAGGRTLEPLELSERGGLASTHAVLWLSKLPRHIVDREADELRRRLEGADLTVEVKEVEADGPGNAVVVVLGFEHVTDVVTGFGVRGVPAETVVAGVVREVKRRLRSDAAVGPHLADQLLVPLAMAGGGAFTTVDPTTHTSTNARVIERFLDVRIGIESVARELWRVTVVPGA
jgi:RNA 3'-terminal phosphate cyclase (ATP)